MMSNLRSKVDWEEVKREMMERYPNLTQDDFEEGDEEKLLMHLGEKIGKSKKEIRFIIQKI